MAYCFSSSCSAHDLSVAIGAFSKEICPALSQDVVRSTRWSSVDSPPELRRRQDRRDTISASMARTMAVASRDSTASEGQQDEADTSSTPSSGNSTSGSGGLSTGAKAGIAIAAVLGVAIIAAGIFIWLRRRRRSPLKSSSLETGKRRTSKKERLRQQQIDEEHKKEQAQLQLQLQQMQQQLQKQKLQEQEVKQKRVLKEEQQQKEESKYVAELFEMPGWMPERQTPVNELADTGQPRYEMMTEANTAEMGPGFPEMDDDDHHFYANYPRRSRSYTAELSGGTPVLDDSGSSDDGELTPLKRSHSDCGPIISPATHASSSSGGGVLSPFEVSPPTATVPGLVFSRGDWRSGGGAQVPTSRRSPHPAIPLGLTVDTGRARAATGKRSKGQRVRAIVPGDIATDRQRDAWA